MENKVDKKKNQPLLVLLPNRYKKVGVALIILTLIAFIVLLILHSTIKAMNYNSKQLIKHSLFLVFTTGVLIIAISKDKIEDELITMMRLRSMAVSFIGGIFYGMVYPFAELIVSQQVASIKSNELIGNMIVMYLVTFYLLKRAR